MNESERQKIERRYRRYYEATEGIRLQERTFVRFLSWLEGKAGYKVEPTAAPLPTAAELTAPKP